jgi:hypothetical protein
MAKSGDSSHKTVPLQTFRNVEQKITLTHLSRIKIFGNFKNKFFFALPGEDIIKHLSAIL